MNERGVTVMTVYIGMLKGINVGKSRRMKMEDFRMLLERIGLKGVETYIQSGNVIFEAEEEEDSVRKSIEEGIEAEFGFEAAVIVRKASELKNLIEGCPFTPEEILQYEESNDEGESFYVALLTEEPSAETVRKLESLRTENDDFRINGRDVYILLRHSIRKSKMAASLQKLEEGSTVRNWKTLNKLNELAGNHKI